MTTASRVALVSTGPPEVLRATTDALENAGWLVVGAPRPLGTDGADAVVANVMERFGRLDLLVAGPMHTAFGAIDELPVDAWWSVVDASLGHAFRLARAAALQLVAVRGSIVLLSSEWGIKGMALGSAVSASAGGMIGLTKALAWELAPNVRVNVVAAGVVDSSDLLIEAQASGRDVDDVRDANAKLALLDRLGSPADVASTIAFLASEAGAFYTGEVLSPSGGRTHR